MNKAPTIVWVVAWVFSLAVVVAMLASVHFDGVAYTDRVRAEERDAIIDIRQILTDEYSTGDRLLMFRPLDYDDDAWCRSVRERLKYWPRIREFSVPLMDVDLAKKRYIDVTYPQKD